MSLRGLVVLFLAIGLPLFFVRPLWAGSEDIFIDPSDPTLIRETQIPFESKILLRASDLPEKSSVHSPVPLVDQSFLSVAPNPQGTQLALSVRAGPLEWDGIFTLADKKIEQLSLHFDIQNVAPSWSPDGNFLVLEEEDSSDRKSLEIYDLPAKNQCVLNGKSAKSKFWNLSEPWWSEDHGKVYFKAEVGNDYRKSLGLKAMPGLTKVGEATTQCQKVVLHSVAKFLADNPREVLPPRIAASLKEPGETGE